MKKVLAFDIGGTNTRLALVNEKFEIEKELIYPTVCGSVDSFLESIKKIIKDLDVDLSEISAIGAGVPGVVDYKNAYIKILPNVHIQEIPLGDYLKKEFGLDLYIRNDAEVASLAEATLGAGKEFERSFFITISTGLGGALCVDGEIQDYVTEIGHTAYVYKGQVDEYEGLASGTGLVKLAKLNGLEVKNSKELFELIKANNELALKVKKEWLHILTDFIQMIMNSYDPDIITVTGGVTKNADMFLDELREMNKNANIVLCHFLEGAGLMGAAKYAFSQLDK